MDTELEISLSDILAFVKKRILLIVLCGVYVMAGAFLVSNYLLKEQFRAEVSMYVAPNADEINRTASLSELNYAQAVVDTYIEILQTKSFLNEVADASGVDYTSTQLKNMISMSALNGTEIFRIRVTSTDPSEAFTIANTMAELAPGKIIEIKDADAVRVVDPATLPIQPVSPNKAKNTLMGFALGIFLGFGIALLLEMNDTRVKSEEDLTRRYDYPVLGVLPYGD